MARTFIGTGQVNYIGAPYTRPVPICNGGTAVPLQFNWIAYGASTAKPTVNVRVSLATPDARAQLLKRISSVYIDNTNSITPIYVYAPDTQYVATAQANSAGWYPLYTNASEIWVIGVGFVDGQIPYTTVFVSDLFIPPYTDLELSQTQTLFRASPVIQQAGQLFQQGNYAVPAIGDQTITAFFLLDAADQGVDIFPVQAGGFYFVTSIVGVFGIHSLAGATLISGAVVNDFANTITKFQFNYFIGPNEPTTVFPYSMSGMNVKLNATTGWRLTLRGIGGNTIAGFFQFNVCYTYSPLNP